MKKNKKHNILIHFFLIYVSIEGSVTTPPIDDVPCLLDQGINIPFG